jgi:hypothetical protein
MNAIINTLIQKGKKLELTDITNFQLELVATKKEVKNASLVRNFISSQEERFVSLILINGVMSLVVFKKQQGLIG